MQTNSYSLAESVTTLFPWLCKLTSVPFGNFYVHRPFCLYTHTHAHAHICVCVCALALYVAWFRNYTHDIAGCHV